MSLQIKFIPFNFSFLWNEEKKIYEREDLNGRSIVLKDLGNMEYTVYRYKQQIYNGRIDTHYFARELFYNLHITPKI